jgi:valyl-tRNA synthetase
MPFVTETLWQALPHEGPALIVASWPEAQAVDEEAEVSILALMDVVRGIRNLRAEYDVPAGRRIPALMVTGDKTALFADHHRVLCTLAHLAPEALQIVETFEDKPGQALTVVEGGVEVYLPLSGLIDLEAEKERIMGEMEALTQRIGDLEIRLRNENFVQKAPAHVVQRERDRRDEARDRWVRLRDRLHQLDEL